jgi:hypothetical protein
MTRDKSIIAGVVVLAGLGFLTFKAVKKDQNIGIAADKASADMPEIKGSDDLDKIVIKNGDKPEVVLEKQGDKWMVTKPVAALANQGNVKSLLDNMKELKAKETIASSADDALKKEYQLDPEHVLHVTGYKGADKKVDDLFGKSGGRGEIMMVGDKPAVYASSGYSSYVYGREVKDWREREIFKFDDAAASQMTLDDKAGAFSFTKGADKWAGTFKGKAIDRLDEEKVKDAVRALKFLNAEDFGDGKTPAETGLDAPESTMAVTLKDGAGKFVLKVGKVSSGTSRYAMKDGDPTVFIVGSSLTDWATAEPSKFQKPVDAGAPKDAGGAAPQMGMPSGMQMPPGMQMPHMPAGHPDTH